jgi:putative membrane-bound dehydrogenase-like protein
MNSKGIGALVVTVLAGAGLFLFDKLSMGTNSKAATHVARSDGELMFPTPYNSEPDKSGPMPALEAAAKMKLPPGFKATVFASEPDVQNPIAMTWDSRGRLWIAENYTYAEPPKNFDLTLRDRILIFEDKNKDGHFSSRKVFTDKLQMLTSIEIGHGGVWAMCPSQLLFIPDKHGNDMPDAAPQVVLDGFIVPPQNYHNFANGLKFGPDGWLYGRCGHSAPGEIGAPGTPDAERIPLRGTIWRYHPQKKIFEALSAGTTNPWGHDWDEHGEMFFINTVNGHLWHEITGAHYMTSGGNAHTYALIDQHADHWHFDTSQSWTKSRNGAADAFGGGHAHVGMMIYLGDNWPAEYRGHLFTFNMHGYRANQEILERTGSGYVGHHGKDFLFLADKWFRGIDLGYGPDGAVFAIDWSDTGECHEHTGVHRTSGRIYKISYGEPHPSEIGDLATLDSRELVKLHTHVNEWFTRQARRQLIDRAEEGADLKDAVAQLRELYDKNADVVVKLRALWTLYDIGATDESFLRAQLHHENEHVRAWAIRLLTNNWPLDTAESSRPPVRGEADTQSLEPEIIRMAHEDPSGLVRLVLASTLQRLPVDHRPALAAELVAHKEDANDHNLPLLIWYGLIPVADAQPLALTKIALRCELPQTRTFIARRLAEDLEKNPAPVNDLLAAAAGSGSEPLQSDILAGLAEAMTGWHKAAKPSSWDDLAKAVAGSKDPAVHDRLRDLNALFGDPKALEEVKAIALDEQAALPAREDALQKVIDHHPVDLRTVCERLLKVQGIGPVAARGLATFDDPTIGKTLVESYGVFAPTDRPQLIAAIVSRKQFAMMLLDAVEAGQIPRKSISPFNARQIHDFKDDALSRKLKSVWGEVREANADKRPIIAAFKAELTPAVLAKADLRQGRAMFTAVCSGCHTLYGEGGKVGPDLTGAGRDNLDYLLENVVDPSAVVPAEYRMTIARLKDGRVLNGIVSAKTDHTITLKMMTETATLELSQITTIQESAQSLMPEGLLEAIGEPGVRDLIGYLMHKGQVPK